MPLATAGTLLLIVLLWLYPLALRRTPMPPNPLNLSLLLFTFMLGVAILITADPDLTLPKATSLILGLTVWRYLVNYVHKLSQLMVGLLLLVGLGAGFVGIGLLAVDWMFKVPLIQDVAAMLPTQLLTLPDTDNGVHTNQLAGTMLPFLPLLLSLLVGWSPSWRWRLLLVALLLVTTAVFILTQSRTGYLAAVGGWLLLGLLWAWLLPPSPQRRWLRLGLVAAGLIGLAGMWGVGSERLLLLWQDLRQETVVSTIGNLSSREEVWRWSLVAIGDFPFTGTGLGTFRQVARRFYPLAINPTYDIAHAHNIFLQTALDVGLPGLIAYLSMVGLALQQGCQAARRSVVLRPTALGLVAGLVALHIFGLADALALGSKSALIFWVMLGLLAALPQVEQNEVMAPLG
jgi:putative inorganic carbon (hco3(-)) transporter